MGNTIQARFGDTDNDYKRLKIQKGKPEVWEDGLRTTGEKGEYEWWYFDSALDDGASLVISFFTTSIASKEAGFHPYLEIRYTSPDGKKISEDIYPTDFSFSEEKCDVKMDGNSITGNLHEVVIVLDGEHFKGKAVLTGRVSPWRPNSGYIYFGEDDYFAWLPSVPEGHVQLTYSIDGGSEQEVSGTGYHDHNWGNCNMMKLMHHWYWGRAKIGEYQVISSYITAQKKYGYEHFPIFFLAKGEQVLGDDITKLTYTQTNLQYDEKINRHYYKDLCYDYVDGQSRYCITYRAEKILEDRYLIGDGDSIKAKAERAALKAMGIMANYIRLNGEVTLEHYENGVKVEVVSAPAIWELMGFGLDEDV